MIGAVRHAGPLRTALVFNVEPVVAIASAVLLLGETLGAGQVLGMALVFAALTLATLPLRQPRPLPPPATHASPRTSPGSSRKFSWFRPGYPKARARRPVHPPVPTALLPVENIQPTK